MLDPGFPACLGSLQTKLKLLLSLSKTYQQTTFMARDKHNVLLYYCCFQWKNEQYKEEYSSLGTEVYNAEGSKGHNYTQIILTHEWQWIYPVKDRGLP